MKKKLTEEHKGKIGDTNRLTADKYKNRYGDDIEKLLRKFYILDGMTLMGVAMKLGISYSVVRNGMKLFDISFKTRDMFIPWNKDKPWSRKIKNKISESCKGRIPWNKRKTAKNDERMRQMVLSKSSKIIEKIKNIYNKYQMNFKNYTWYLYFDQRKSLAQIADIIGISKTHTKRIFKEFDFISRSSRESHLGKKQSKELVEKRIRAIMASLCVKPNGKELELLGLFRENDLPYKFVGDGKFWIKGKNPDFINTNHQKSLVELFGDYWHKGDDGEERKEIFARYGYRTLIIWEHELDDKQTLLERVKSFEESN